MKRTLLTLSLALTVAAVAAPAASAKTLVVDDDNGCADKQYSTIQSAVNAAAPGNTVAVCPGFYNEYVQIQKAKLKLISRVRHGATIQAPADSIAVYNDAPGVLIRGFAIKGDAGRVNCRAGMELFNWTTVDHNRFSGLTCGEGIIADVFIDPGTTTIASNEFTEFSQAIDVRSATGLTRIQNNWIHDSSDDLASGIDVDCCQTKIQSNVIENILGIGISVNGFEEENLNSLIAGNRVRNASYGIVTSEIGIGIGFGNPRIKVERNRVTGNAVYGLWHDGSGPAYFKENTALGNFGLDCFDSAGSSSVATWTRNIGETDSPSNICRPPD